MAELPKPLSVVHQNSPVTRLPSASSTGSMSEKPTDGTESKGPSSMPHHADA